MVQPAAAGAAQPVRARYLVDAHGPRSLVRNTLGIRLRHFALAVHRNGGGAADQCLCLHVSLHTVVHSHDPGGGKSCPSIRCHTQASPCRTSPREPSLRGTSGSQRPPSRRATRNENE